MSDALRERLTHPVSTAHKLADAVGDRLRGHAPVTPDDERAAAEEWRRSRGLHLSREERSRLAYEQSKGAPIIMVRPRSRNGE